MLRQRPGANSVSTSRASAAEIHRLAREACAEDSEPRQRQQLLDQGASRGRSRPAWRRAPARVRRRRGRRPCATCACARIAAIGVRSSCATSAVKRRSLSSSSAMRANRPFSARRPTGRSRWACRRRLASGPDRLQRSRNSPPRRSRRSAAAAAAGRAAPPTTAARRCRRQRQQHGRDQSCRSSSAARMDRARGQLLADVDLACALRAARPRTRASVAVDGGRAKPLRWNSAIRLRRRIGRARHQLALVARPGTRPLSARSDCSVGASLRRRRRSHRLLHRPARCRLREVAVEQLVEGLAPPHRR